MIALVFGFGIMAAGKKAQPVADLVNSMSEVCIKIMHGIICFAPFGVFGLITPVIASNGPDILLPLLKLIVVAYLAMILHMAVVYSGLVKVLANVSPIRFFKEQMSAMVFAFASASSVGTLPVNMECSKKLGVSNEVSSFVLPLGATINMDGTSIYMGVCSIFIAHAARVARERPCAAERGRAGSRRDGQDAAGLVPDVSRGRRQDLDGLVGVGQV